MKNSDLTENERKEEVSFMVHRKRARSFYDALNLNLPAIITVCFDIMENLLLPKTPVGQSFYSRQLYQYVLAIVQHYGKTHLKIQKAYNFTRGVNIRTGKTVIW